MINYEEELKKFKPSKDIDDIEEVIYAYDTKDIIDILANINDKKGRHNDGK